MQIKMTIPSDKNSPAHGLVELIEKVLKREGWVGKPYEDTLFNLTNRATVVNDAAVRYLVAVQFGDEKQVETGDEALKQQVIALTAAAIELFMETFDER